MRSGVFLGPSLSVATARRIADTLCFEPAQRGDIYRAVNRFDLQAIGLIDGYFHQVPSVWHKEILWAMSRGVHVLGAASMGALRAAELVDYGMVGVGGIFESYRAGRFIDPQGRLAADERFEDDDEVALVHGPRAAQFRATSEPLVNIRATLAAARRAGMLEPAHAQLLLATAKQTHYAKRTWPRLLQSMRASAPEHIAGFQRWLADARVDMKGEDAKTLLARLAALQTPRGAVDFELAQTDAWLAFVAAEQPAQPH